jgi:hypothetical protein
LAILGGVATLSLAGFSVINPVAAQTPTGDISSMTGNTTGGNVTGGNMTGSISSFDESEAAVVQLASTTVKVDVLFANLAE